MMIEDSFFVFFFQAEDGIRDVAVTGVQTCALPILEGHRREPASSSWDVAQRAGRGTTQVTRQDRASCGGRRGSVKPRGEPRRPGDAPEMASRLSGKVCVITGTGGSMGREAARVFARE